MRFMKVVIFDIETQDVESNVEVAPVTLRVIIGFKRTWVRTRNVGRV